MSLPIACHNPNMGAPSFVTKNHAYSGATAFPPPWPLVLILRPIPPSAAHTWQRSTLSAVLTLSPPPPPFEGADPTVVTLNKRLVRRTHSRQVREVVGWSCVHVPPAELALRRTLQKDQNGSVVEEILSTAHPNRARLLRSRPISVARVAFYFGQELRRVYGKRREPAHPTNCRHSAPPSHTSPPLPLCTL